MTHVLATLLLVGCGSAVSIEGPAGDGGGGLVSGDDDDGEGGSGASGSLCTLPDPTLSFELGVNASAWQTPLDPNDPYGEPANVVVEGSSCDVVQVDSDGGVIRIDLSCAHEEVGTASVEVILSELPEDFALGLGAGEEVVLDYFWRSDGHHISSGEWLVIERGDGDVVLAAAQFDSVSAMAERMAHFSLETDDSLCVAPCDVGSYCDEPWRLGLNVDSEEGTRLTLIDGSRGTIDSRGLTYDAVLARAERYTCLNCPTIIGVVMGARP